MAEEKKETKSVEKVSNSVSIEKRDIALSIILSIITCGIYGIYWLYCITEDANKLSGEDSPSGAISVLLSLVTCNIFKIYWNYIMGKKLATAGEKHGLKIEDNSILYLLLCIFGLGIVNYCLIQSDINKLAESK